MIDVPLYPKSVYESAENSIATEQLINAFNPDLGLVALPKNPNFLPSEQFPWDSSKEVYVTAGYHSLHSLVSPIPFPFTSYPQNSSIYSKSSGKSSSNFQAINPSPPILFIQSTFFGETLYAQQAQRLCLSLTNI